MPKPSRRDHEQFRDGVDANERRRARRQARKAGRLDALAKANAFPTTSYRGPIRAGVYGAQSRLAARTRKGWTDAGILDFVQRLDACSVSVDTAAEWVGRAALSLPTGGEIHLALQGETHGVARANHWGLFPEWANDGEWLKYLRHLEGVLAGCKFHGVRSVCWNVERESDPGAAANWADHPHIPRRADQLRLLARHHGLSVGLVGSLHLEGKRAGCRSFAAALLGTGGRWWAEDGYTYAHWRWPGQEEMLHSFAEAADWVGSISPDYGKMSLPDLEPAERLAIQRDALFSAAIEQVENRAWLWCQNGLPLDWTLRDEPSSNP